MEPDLAPSTGLDHAALDSDPIRQLRVWLDEAAAAGHLEPLAMTLATVTADCRPSARMVLLRGLDERGLVAARFDPDGELIDVGTARRAAALSRALDGLLTGLSKSRRNGHAGADGRGALGWPYTAVETRHDARIAAGRNTA